MDGEAKTQTIAMRKKIYLYRALWLALLDIDRCKSDRDHSDYKFRARKTQIASLQDICEQKHLKRYGNKDQLHNFTGESLYQALANQWNVLRTTASMTFTVLFREGTGSCKRSRLNEFQNGYDAFVREEHLLPQKNGVAGRQVVVEIPAPRSNREYEIMVPISSRCSKRKEDFTQVATPKRTTRNDRKRKLSSDIDAPRRVSEYTAHQSNVVVNIASISSEPLVFDNIRQELAVTYGLLQQSVLWASGHLRLLKCQAVASPEPTYSLLPLYERCWGKDWRSGADSLLDSHHRSVEDDTLALISAFLLDQILLRTGICKLKATNLDEFGTPIIPSSFQSSLVNYADINPAESTEPQNADDTKQKSLSALAEASLLAVKAESLTAHLVIALAPYIEGLAEMSCLMHATQFEGEINPLSHSQFRRDLSRAVETVLRLRTKLDDSKYEASFLWPERGESFDPSQMQIPYELQDSGLGESYTVAFTKFPGVKVKYTRQQGVETEVAYKACVVLRMEAAE
jgi:hypothetical protein